MNWYKRATRSPRLANDIYPQIDQIVEKIVLFFRANNKAPSRFLRVGTIVSHNPYYNVNVKAEVYLTNKYIEYEGVGGYRDRITGNIFLNVLKKGFAKNQEIELETREKYKTFLEHELTHSSDIKINDKKLINRFNYFDHIEEEKIRPTEFDAYSKNIVGEIKSFYNKNDSNKKLVKDIIKSDNIMNLLNNHIISYNLANIIYFWFWNKPEYYKTLLMRIYNEVINENSF